MRTSHTQSVAVSHRVTAYADARRGGWFRDRGDVIQRDLDRYAVIREAELRSLALTDSEMNLIRDSMNGVMVNDQDGYLTLVDCVEAGLSEGLAEKWNVDDAALLKRLRCLSVAGCFAVIDSVEVFWLGDSSDSSRRS